MDYQMNQLLHPDGRPIAPLERLRGSQFVGSGSLVSGAVVSGGGLTVLAVVSAPSGMVGSVIIPLNLEMHNDEPGWVQVEFRDGGFAGGRVCGPYDLNPRQRLAIPQADLEGRRFTSSVYGMVLSGWTGQPLSNGVKINMGYIRDPGYFLE